MVRTQGKEGLLIGCGIGQASCRIYSSQRAGGPQLAPESHTSRMWHRSWHMKRFPDLFIFTCHYNNCCYSLLGVRNLGSHGVSSSRSQ